MNKTIILSSAALLAVVAIVAGATTAFYSDTETSAGNVFAAGAIDLKIDNESYYNGVLNTNTTWELDDLDDKLFFDFHDMKPGDDGEDTISIHVDNNDAWMCMDINLTSANDNGLTEPESGDGDTTGGVGEGELQEEVNFIWWKDDGDNVLEEGENVFNEALLSELDGYSVPLSDSTDGGIFGSSPIEGSQTYYIGKAWCYGEITVNYLPQDGFGKTGSNGPSVRGAGIECEGSLLNNITQTDSVTGDLKFFAIQSRNNPDFKCEGGKIGCFDKADVILVLDKSGSISAAEMATLKTAAKAFVDALAPSADGVHVGMVSFSNTAALNSHLTDDGAAVKTAIDALVSGGTTNLAAGISTADTELDNPGDGHDRGDIESPDFIVIITDGVPNTGGTGETQATAAKADGIEIFAVGVGITESGKTLLKDKIVSPPANSHYFDAIDFDDLEAILEDIATCEG